VAKATEVFALQNFQLTPVPHISLVVCVHNEGNLLARLLETADGCYDDLVVVHDGPESVSCAKPSNFGDYPTTLAVDFSNQDLNSPLPAGFTEPGKPATPGSVNELVINYQGRFFEHPRIGSLEGQSPFAWSRAANNWILRLDADEVPSVELKQWLRSFRAAPEPDPSISGYTCIWPLWNGHQIVTKRWPASRIFLFQKQRVRFFGMVEQVPIADGKFESLPLILEHRPARKSYGFSNLLLRKQAYHWRRVIAKSLLGKPTDLQCWRWASEEWPMIWEEIRRHPMRTAFYRLLVWPLSTLRQMKRVEGRIIPSAIVFAGVHHCLVAIMYSYRRLSRSKT
jgi:hypothetical protein